MPGNVGTYHEHKQSRRLASSGKFDTMAYLFEQAVWTRSAGLLNPFPQSPSRVLQLKNSMQHLPSNAVNGYPVEHLKGSVGPEVTDACTGTAIRASHGSSDVDALVAPVSTSKPRKCFVVACPDVLIGLRVHNARHEQYTRHALVGGCGAGLLSQWGFN